MAWPRAWLTRVEELTPPASELQARSYWERVRLMIAIEWDQAQYRVTECSVPVLRRESALTDYGVLESLGAR